MANKTYDQYMSESGKQSTLDQQRASGTYDQAKKSYEGGSVLGASSSPSGAATGGVDFSSVLGKAREMAQESIKPAVESYQSQIPTTQAIYGAERERLGGEKQSVIDRTAKLIDQITKEKGLAETRQTLTTSKELGRRGISGRSGLAEREITQALQPISTQFGGMLTQAGQSQEDQLRAISSALGMLVPQEQQSINAINSAIAQMQAGVLPTAMSGAGQMFGANMAGQQFASDRSFDDLQRQMMQAQIGQANRSNIGGGGAGGGGYIDFGAYEDESYTSQDPTTSTGQATPWLSNDPAAAQRAQMRQQRGSSSPQVQGASTGFLSGIGDWFKKSFGNPQSTSGYLKF